MELFVCLPGRVGISHEVGDILHACTTTLVSHDILMQWMVNFIIPDYCGQLRCEKEFLTELQKNKETK
jgi:hypothetical protein